jgi:hypothetical protein
MKKLVCLIVALSAATVMAAPTFVLPVQVDVLPGQTIPVVANGLNLADNVVVGGPANGLHGSQGMALFLGANAPLVLSGLDMITGTVWETNNAGAAGGNIDDQTVSGTIGTASGVVGDGVLFSFVLNIPAGTPVGVYKVSTDLGVIDPVNYAGIVSDLTGTGGENGQATMLVNVTPEPVSALLLLAGLPLLRRRHA